MAAPAPPGDLHSRSLSLRTLQPQTRLWRIHDARREPVWFGPAPGSPPRNRFDAPSAEFRVCYLALTPEAAFAETFLRNPGRRLIDYSTLADRALTELATTRPLALASLSGPDLARVGATAEVTHGPDYDIARRWSSALWQHPLSPAGILYKSRHDDDELCLALFDRYDDALDVVQTQRVLEFAGLWPLLTRYGLGLNRAV